MLLSNTRKLGIWIRHLKHSMERNTFDGRNPVSVLSFLAEFKRACDGESVPEAAALQIAPYFLDGHPREISEGTMDDANAGFGDFNTWPHAMRFLLETYSTDANLERAIDDIEGMSMTAKESIHCSRVRMTAATCVLAGSYPPEALMNQFIRNLPTHVRDIVRLEAHKYKRPSALTKVSDLATDYYETHKNLPALRFERSARGDHALDQPGPPHRRTTTSGFSFANITQSSRH